MEWVSLIVGIMASAIIAIVAHFISKAEPSIAYQSAHQTVIGNYSNKFEGKELKLYFNDELVEQVSKTQIAMWNQGAKTVKGSDIVAKDPIRIVSPEGSKILAFSIISSTREINGCKLEMNNDSLEEILLAFDYLDRRDGVVIEIIHTGGKLKPVPHGNIKGMPKGIRNKGSVTYPLLEEKTKKSIADRLKWFAMICGLSLFLLAFLSYNYFFIDKMKLFDDFGRNIIPAFFGSLISVMILFKIQTFKNRRFPNKLLKVDNK